MEDYDMSFYTTDCEHCGKISLHQGQWIYYGRSEFRIYKCGWCGEISKSRWHFADISIVNNFLFREPYKSFGSVPRSFQQYPIKEE